MSLRNSPRRRGARRSLALLRRIWIIPVSIVVVGAIAYEVAGLQSATYTAQSNVVVTSAPGPIGSSGAANAGDLAATYAGALPSDPVLRSYVASTSHVPVSNNSISALPTQGSVVRLRFTADTAHAAVAGAKAIASGLAKSKPVSSVVTAGALKVLQTPTTATLNASGTYSAKVVLIVPLSSGPTEGINPDDADHLAATYAGIIPVDGTLLHDVGKAVGQSQSQVGENLSVVNEQTTSILQISFKASTPQAATIGARAAANLLTGPNPVAAGIVPSSLDIVSLPPPSNSVAATPTRKGSTVAIGAVLGLILGLVLLVAWERSDPHVVDARSLSSQFGCPATPAERLSPDAAHALIERWASLTDRVPARVALLPADAASVRQTDEVAALLASSGAGIGYIDARTGTVPEAFGNGHPIDGKEPVVLVHAAPPGRGGEAVGLNCDLTVVVVRTGARNNEIRRLAEELANFGLVQAWALLAPRRGHVGTQQQPHADAIPA
jgi:capsular polysaccharide biosynthesis protein